MGPSKNREQGVKMVMKGLGTTYKHANQLVDKILGVNPKTGKIESAELDEGYESEVLKVLKDADIDGYFKMGKHLSNRTNNVIVGAYRILLVVLFIQVF
mgnify:CR=1 FL=1